MRGFVIENAVISPEAKQNLSEFALEIFHNSEKIKKNNSISRKYINLDIEDLAPDIQETSYTRKIKTLTDNDWFSKYPLSFFYVRPHERIIPHIDIHDNDVSRKSRHCVLLIPIYPVNLSEFQPTLFYRDLHSDQIVESITGPAYIIDTHNVHGAVNDSEDLRFTLQVRLRNTHNINQVYQAYLDNKLFNTEFII